MIVPAKPRNELERLASLEKYKFHSVYNSDEFNFLTELAAQISGCDISLISLIYEDKQWFLSHHGLAVSETPRDYAFCAHAILEPNQILTVENALEDKRFSDNPLVTGDPHIRFYSGIPVFDGDGLPLGTLCVIDKESRQLNDNQIKSLRKIAEQVQKLFELQKLRVEEKKRSRESELNLVLLQDSQELNRIGAWKYDIDTKEVFWTEMVYKIHEVDLSFSPKVESAVNFYHEDDRQYLLDNLNRCIDLGTEFSIHCRLITSTGNLIWVRSSGRKVGNQLVGSFQDITSIKEKEIKFESIINASTSLLVILDKSGRITELNNTSTELVHMSREDFLGKFFWDCNYWNVGANVIDDLKEKFNKALQGIETSEEMVFWLFGEITFTVHFIVRPVYDERKDIAFVLVEAIPIQDLVDERNHNRFVIEGANVATGQWNCITDEIVFDERWYEILGYSSQELEPMNLRKWESFYHPDDLPRCREILYKVFEKELEFYDFEARLKHKDGHWVWINDKGKVLHWSQDGKPLYMYGIHHDVTIRKEKELQLVYQENLLNTLFRNSPVGIVLTDFKDSLYLDVNQSFMDLVGYGKTELLQMTFEDITPLEFKEIEEKIRIDLAQNKFYRSFHKEYIRKDGSRIPVIIQGMLVKDNKDRELVWTFIQDISKEKHAENEIRALLELTQDQNERLNNFARIVSHNLKNHSDGILGILDLLQEQNPDLAQNKYLRMFEKSAKNLVQTISYLTEEKLLKSKLGTLVLENVNMSKLIEKNIESSAAELIKFDFVIDNQIDSNKVVLGVPAYLDSIVLNLISNAIKYRNQSTSSKLWISSYQRNGFQVFEFKDNGLGIDMDVHGSDIFKLYKTFHENLDSRGVGLFITKNQIEQMGGKIDVESQLYKGTTFRVFLPLPNFG